MSPDYRDFEKTRPITNSNEWQDYVLRLRLTWPAPLNDQEKLDRNIRIVAILSDIRNQDHRHRCLQGFVHSLLARKKAGQKRAEQDEKFARRDFKIHLELEGIREQGLSKNDAAQQLLDERQKYGFDDLPATVEGIYECDRRARKLWGLKPSRQKKARTKLR
jgi:hypothetical protein